MPRILKACACRGLPCIGAGAVMCRALAAACGVCMGRVVGRGDRLAHVDACRRCLARGGGRAIVCVGATCILVGYSGAFGIAVWGLPPQLYKTLALLMWLMLGMGLA